MPQGLCRRYVYEKRLGLENWYKMRLMELNQGTDQPVVVTAATFSFSSTWEGESVDSQFHYISTPSFMYHHRILSPRRLLWYTLPPMTR